MLGIDFKVDRAIFYAYNRDKSRLITICHFWNGDFMAPVFYDDYIYVCIPDDKAIGVMKKSLFLRAHLTYNARHIKFKAFNLRESLPKPWLSPSIEEGAVLISSVDSELIDLLLEED